MFRNGLRRWGLLLLSAALLGCSSSERVVAVAVAVPLTGDMGNEGQGVRRAVTLAIEQANDSRRLPYRLEVLAFDDRDSAAEAVRVANLVASSRRIVAVVGPYTSGSALAAGPTYARGHIPMLTPSATNPEVTTRQLSPDWPGPRQIFRLVATDDAQGAFAGDFVARRLRLQRMAVIADRTPYGHGLAMRFARSYKAAGGRVVLDESVAVGVKDFAGLAARLESVRPDGVFFGGQYAEAGLLLLAMRGGGLNQVFVSGDGAHTASLIDVAGEAADGAYLTMVAAPLETLARGASFAARYKSRWRGVGEEVKPFDHLAYEAAELIIDALAKVGPDRDKLIEQLHASRHDGLLGPLSFDDKGDALQTVVTMTRARAKDRSFVVVR